MTKSNVDFQFVKDSSLENTLAALSKSVYTWEELQQRPLPDGVDPAKLEKYLSDKDFKVRTLFLEVVNLKTCKVFFVFPGPSWPRQGGVQLLSSLEKAGDTKGARALLMRKKPTYYNEQQTAPRL